MKEFVESYGQPDEVKSEHENLRAYEIQYKLEKEKEKEKDNYKRNHENNNKNDTDKESMKGKIMKFINNPENKFKKTFAINYFENKLAFDKLRFINTINFYLIPIFWTKKLNIQKKENDECPDVYKNVFEKIREKHWREYIIWKEEGLNNHKLKLPLEVLI